MSESTRYGGKRKSRTGLKATIAGLVVAFFALVAGLASCGGDDNAPDPVPSVTSVPVTTQPVATPTRTTPPATRTTNPPEPEKTEQPEEPTITDPVGPEPTGVTSPPSTD